MSASNWARFLVVTLVVFVLQVGVLDQIVVFGAHPDAMVLIPPAAALRAGSERGAVAGFIAGIVADLVVPLPFGLSALVFILIGFGTGLVATLPGRVDFRGGDAVFCVFAAAVGTALYVLIAALLGQPKMVSVHSGAVIVVVTAAAVVLALPVLRAVSWAFTGSAPAGRSMIPSGGSALG